MYLWRILGGTKNSKMVIYCKGFLNNKRIYGKYLLVGLMGKMLKWSNRWE